MMGIRVVAPLCHTPSYLYSSRFALWRLVAWKTQYFKSSRLLNRNLYTQRYLSCTSRAFTTELKAGDDSKFLRRLRVNTCSDLYQEWYTMKVNRSKPLRGVDLDVLYLDSNPTAPNDVPVILVLHEVAGSHRQYLSLLPYLLKTGARVIIPNFPGFGFTVAEKDDISHTDQERAIFILDFITALGISKVHLLLSQGTAIYPACYLLRDKQAFQSVVLLNPTGAAIARFFEPVWLIQFIAACLEIPGLALLVRLLKIFLRVSPSVQMLYFEQFKAIIRSLIFVNYANVQTLFTNLKFRKYPMMLITTDDDDIVGKVEREKMLSFFGSNVLVVPTADEMHETEFKMDVTRYPAAIVFKNGGHFIAEKSPEVVGKAIEDLFFYATKSNVR